jgi:hypothetical protein
MKNNENLKNLRKKFKKAHNRLRLFIILLNILATLTGFLVFIPLSYSFQNSNNECLLFSSFEVSVLEKANNDEIYINSSFHKISELNEAKIIWSTRHNCEYIIIVGLINTFMCILAIFFFIMFNMKELVANDYCLLIPSIILSSINTIIIFIAVYLSTYGFATFCKNFYMKLIFSFKELTDSHGLNWYHCRLIQTNNWKNFNAENLFDNYLISSLSLWLLFFLVILLDFAILMRIILVIKYMKYQENKNEFLIIKYARILKTQRINKSYDIQLPVDFDLYKFNNI